MMNIPFTTEQFFEVIVNYNRSVFPAQVLLFLGGLLSVLMIHSGKSAHRNRIIGGFLGFLWIWTGITYHLMFFTTINKAAYGFGILYIIQGLLFLYETFFRKKLEFEFQPQLRDFLAYFFILFGLVIYPILIYSMELSLEGTISLGLPCPSTILTFGFLLLTTTSLSKYLLTIPVLWAIIGTSAAFNFGVYPDYLLIISAVIAVFYLVRRKRHRIA
jgi:hypothetical protein